MIIPMHLQKSLKQKTGDSVIWRFGASRTCNGLPLSLVQDCRLTGITAVSAPLSWRLLPAVWWISMDPVGPVG